MSLGKEQRKFSIMIARLVMYAYAAGYETSKGDGYRDPRVFGKVGEKKGYGHASSAHKLRLAEDINLFKDGEYLTKTSDHEFLGIKWESMGGSWGGRFKNPDGNHYSLEYKGIK
jgi:hypothetical protein